jgi:hypothetical protein
MKLWFLTVVPKYLNCDTFSNWLSAIFMSWFWPVFRWRDSNELRCKNFTKTMVSDNSNNIPKTWQYTAYNNKQVSECMSKRSLAWRPAQLVSLQIAACGLDPLECSPIIIKGHSRRSGTTISRLQWELSSHKGIQMISSGCYQCWKTEDVIVHRDLPDNRARGLS